MEVNEMDQKVMLKQMVEFNKSTFDNSFKAMVMLQEQTEKMVNTMLGQATWLPEEGKKALKDWVKSYKKGRDDFKKLVDESFKKVEDFFVSS
jgi:polyhydroxyalkanoate synthesis regulator phasin